MNRYVTEKWSWIEGSNELRDEVLGVLTDADLAFSPGGDNLTLGELFRQMGEVEHAYLHGLTTLTQDWSYRNEEPGLEGSTERLLAWFHDLDGRLHAAASAFSDDDLAKTVKRASGFEMPIEMSLDVYLQALLIFLGKAVIYLKAMKRPLPEGVRDWIW
jgi:hypothetical protein